MSVENNYSVYVHINKINNKRYYGITSQKPKDRWRNGKGYKNHKNNKKDTYFYNAIRKYGWDNFKHEVLFEGLTKEEACLLEQCYIVLYDTTNRNKGYNRTTGGESFNHTDDTKKALSDLYKGENNPFYGKTHSEETKQKISKANSGANNGHARKVIQYDRGGNVIKTWECIMDASIGLNINYCSIIACCNGRQKTAGGFVWKYARDEVEDILCA